MSGAIGCSRTNGATVVSQRYRSARRSGAGNINQKGIVLSRYGCRNDRSPYRGRRRRRWRDKQRLWFNPAPLSANKMGPGVEVVVLVVFRTAAFAEFCDEPLRSWSGELLSEGPKLIFCRLPPGRSKAGDDGEPFGPVAVGPCIA